MMELIYTPYYEDGEETRSISHDFAVRGGRIPILSAPFTPYSEMCREAQALYLLMGAPRPPTVGTWTLNELRRASLIRYVHEFTFGAAHTTSFPHKARLTDHWVSVCSLNMNKGPRTLFMESFGPYLPTPNQFSFEYRPHEFNPEYFPAGCLAYVTIFGEVIPFEELQK